MANRHLLAENKLEEFKSWLIKHDWHIEPIKSKYEVLRARTSTEKQPLIVYKKDKAGLIHLSLSDYNSRFVVEFINDNKNESEKKQAAIQEAEKVAEVISKKDYDSIYNKYKLAITANNQLADKLSESEKKVKDLQLQLFAFVRNSCVAPVGLKLKKTQQEITDKTFETIREAQKIIDSGKMRAFMNLATNKEDRYDN
jgi:hypothetical protein